MIWLNKLFGKSDTSSEREAPAPLDRTAKAQERVCTAMQGREGIPAIRGDIHETLAVPQVQVCCKAYEHPEALIMHDGLSVSWDNFDRNFSVGELQRSLSTFHRKGWDEIITGLTIATRGPKVGNCIPPLALKLERRAPGTVTIFMPPNWLRALEEYDARGEEGSDAVDRLPGLDDPTRYSAGLGQAFARSIHRLQEAIPHVWAEALKERKG